VNCSADTEHHILINKLKQLSLQELTQIEIFNLKANLPARKVQKLTETSTALFVITQDDIRRAGITSLPEILRMIPGMQVAKINSNKWAITTRGLNGLFDSKLLVMIDGRSVYSILRSEVNWDTQDLLLEDIERIEVIRGPGASLWGANAVNGIINIVTKSSKDTQKNLITTTIGKGEENIIIGLRNGGKINDTGYYRVYSKFYQHDNFVDSQGINQKDDWQMKRAGFRIDQDINNSNNLTVQGDVYEGFTKQNLLSFQTGELFHDVTDISGFNILGRWQANNIILQTYYDQTKRQKMSLGDKRGTFDIDFQHSWQLNANQGLIWGLGYRYTHDDMNDSLAVSYTPKKRQDNLFSIFAEGEFRLQNFKLTLGSRIEHNNYSGLEIQPTVRILWNKQQHSFWGAISRAVRSPTRTDENVQYFLSSNAMSNILQNINYNNPAIPQNQVPTMILQGNTDYKAETVLAYELGYRFNITNKFLLDTTIFYNDYEKLRVFQPIQMIPPSTIILQTMNKMYGETYGLEVAVSWQITDNWKLISTYNYLDIQLHLDTDVILVPPLDDFFSEVQEGYSPHHQANIRSLLSLPNNLELDMALYYVDNIFDNYVDSYNRFDIRLGWNPKDWQFSFGIRNLFDKQQREFGNSISDNYIIADEVRRSFYIQMKHFF